MSVALPSLTASKRNVQFINGQWFDGKKFTARTFYSVGGVLTSKRPSDVDAVIDLKTGYVIPPFGEAHNHNIEGGEPEKRVCMYLEDGIFYVKNPNNLPRNRTALAGKINTPTSVDVVFSNGGLTSTGGQAASLASLPGHREGSRGIGAVAGGFGSSLWAFLLVEPALFLIIFALLQRSRVRSQLP